MMFKGKTGLSIGAAGLAVGALVLAGAPAAQATATPNALPYTKTDLAVPALGTGELYVGSYYLATRYPGSYRLTDAATGDGARATLNGEPGYSLWGFYRISSFDSRGGAWYNLKDIGGFCLDAENDAGGSPNDNGDKVQVWGCQGAIGDAQQQWYFWPVSDGAAFEVVNHFNTNMVLDAETDATWNPAKFNDPVQLYYHNSEVQQQWVTSQ